MSKQNTIKSYKKVMQVTGSTIGITFNQTDREVNNIEVGDYIDISDMVVIKSKEKSK